MRKIIVIITYILLSSCGRNSTLDKKEAFSLLRSDNSIIPAIEHFSLLVNRDSLPNPSNSPVLLHVLVSDSESSQPFCTITATRKHEQYANAKIIGETECNGYRVIFHSRSSLLTPRVLKNVNMRETNYIEVLDFEASPAIENHSYEKDLYMVWYNISENATLQYDNILARSPSEMREWGIEFEMTH